MDQFLPDKITPPAELPRVARVRLLGMLAACLEGCNSTIIQGRTGTGKTMLATDFARRCGRRVAWYKVDAPDSELGVFFQYLSASIATGRPGFGRKILERVGGNLTLEDVPLVVEYFVYELLESAEPLLIVIDDLHQVYDADWVVPFFRRTLPLLPREVHVVLIGRSLPPTPLWRMRSKQTLCVIDEPALAFTPEEARQLFASYGLEEEHTAQLLQLTRGRAAAVDDATRAAVVAAEAATIVAAAGESRRAARSLRLVKGFRKTSFGRV